MRGISTIFGRAFVALMQFTVKEGQKPVVHKCLSAECACSLREIDIQIAAMLDGHKCLSAERARSLREITHNPPGRNSPVTNAFRLNVLVA